MPMRCEQSLMNEARLMGSSITEMLFTMLLMASERFTGSVTPWSMTRVLNSMKSVWCSSI